MLVISISRFRRDLAPGSSLSDPEYAPRRLLCDKTVNALCWYRDFNISARFGFPPGIIRLHLKNTENISVAPAQGWHAQTVKCKHLLMFALPCKLTEFYQFNHLWVSHASLLVKTIHSNFREQTHDRLCQLWWRQKSSGCIRKVWNETNAKIHKVVSSQRNNTKPIVLEHLCYTGNNPKVL